METIKFDLNKYKASKKCFVKTKSVKELKRIRVRAYKLAEAEEIIYFAIHNGFEGAKNDSYRYCKFCLNYDKCCYICVSIPNHYSRGRIIVSNAHWGERKKFVEVSRSKFEEIVRKNRTI